LGSVDKGGQGKMSLVKGISNSELDDLAVMVDEDDCVNKCRGAVGSWKNELDEKMVDACLFDL